ncbi:type II secretion system protein [Candidatus Parcubacteria bacterium]|nr:MAG: type II secretion system protein [Candidatus Parcubacteria bacterium]
MYKVIERARGFTLIELLVVVAIIGILSSVVLASLNSARQKGRDTRRISDIKQLQLALELSYDAVGEYPDSLGDLDPTYISVVPTPPTGAGQAAYGYDNVTSADAACAVATGVCSSYVLMAILEDSNHSALAGAWPTDVASVSCDQAPEYCVRP